jgi:16S rRNA (cytosine1402-N4)-methyltransferase
MNDNQHTPVLLLESLEYLIADKSGIYFDGTLGFGGHASEILKQLNSDGRLFATDADENAFKFSMNRFSEDDRIKLYNFNFKEIETIAKLEFTKYFDGILVDLGVSSFQLDNPVSGFTYKQKTLLDLRFSKSIKLTASDLVNNFSEEEIADILFNYGEEKNSKKIAKEICKYRAMKKIVYTSELAEIIKRITPPIYFSKTLSRVFQALRIFINDELETLRSFLIKSVDLLKVGGRLVVISYHSLEDRIVKELMKYESLNCICPKDYPVCVCGKKSRVKILTKKPITPSVEEIRNNFRSRSAKLRAAERI